MKPTHSAIGSRAFAALLIFASAAVAQEGERQKITEKDKQVFRNLKEAVTKMAGRQEIAARRTFAVSNLRQIGLALFEFETEFGFFPSAETAVSVKSLTGYKGELAAETANDCFFQLMASGMTRNAGIFTAGDAPADPNPAPKPGADAEAPVRLEKCSFAYIPARNAAVSPRRPLAVTPLVKGKAVFDPTRFGGRAIILRVDNSVSSVPIEEDGRVLIDGRDIFDPEQTYWGGDEPVIKWAVE